MKKINIVEEIRKILNNLGDVCTNKIKAETIARELETLGVLQNQDNYSKQDMIFMTNVDNKWEN